MGSGAMLESYSKPSSWSISRPQRESSRMDHSGALYPVTGFDVTAEMALTAFFRSSLKRRGVML
jgi:hypothetical protein